VKTYSILFVIVVLMHTITLMNITLFKGEWNGIVLLLSTILFLIAVVYFSVERRANNKTTQTM